MDSQWPYFNPHIIGFFSMNEPATSFSVPTISINNISPYTHKGADKRIGKCNGIARRSESYKLALGGKAIGWAGKCLGL